MSSTFDEPAPVVTMDALYGAAGTAIAARVAERLGVPFLDRAIPERRAWRRCRMPRSSTSTCSGLAPGSAA